MDDLQLWQGVGLAGLMAIVWPFVLHGLSLLGVKPTKRMLKFTGFILGIVAGGISVAFGIDTEMHFINIINNFFVGFMIGSGASGLHSVAKNALEGVKNKAV